jgi:hypothetical protein
VKIGVLELRPTQIALGVREVARKAAKLRAMSHDERRDYLHSRPVPVVRAPRGTYYLIDHHHQLRASWESGVDEVIVEVKADLSALTQEAFWTEMRRSHWVHPYDQFGGGPHDLRLLPEDIRGLADDPYRSLAWVLRHEGLYEKSEVPFAEFLWADFLRREIVAEPGDAGYAQAAAAARRLAHSARAKNLPGWKGS